MQRPLQWGAFLIAGTWLVGCSEDPDARRFMPTNVVGLAGAGGAGGASASAGSGGSGGVVSNAGSNTGGVTGSGPMTFPPPPCMGCIEMDVPVAPNATSLVAMFNFVFPTAVDLSGATVTWRVSSLNTGADFYVTPYAQNGMALNYAGVYRPQTLLTAENGFTGTGTAWVNLVLDLANTEPLAGAAAPTPAPVADAGADAGDAGGSVGGGGPLLANNGMDKATVVQLGLQIGALATVSQATTLRILVDSVTFDGVPDLPLLRDRDFADGVQDFMANTYQPPPNTVGPTKY